MRPGATPKAKLKSAVSRQRVRLKRRGERLMIKTKAKPPANAIPCQRHPADAVGRAPSYVMKREPISGLRARMPRHHRTAGVTDHPIVAPKYRPVQFEFDLVSEGIDCFEACGRHDGKDGGS